MHTSHMESHTRHIERHTPHAHMESHTRHIERHTPPHAPPTSCSRNRTLPLQTARDRLRPTIRTARAVGWGRQRG
jgi:hypothetical protein